VTSRHCPHYLTFAAEEIADRATEFKCAPPIRAHETRERLWDALREGEIDLIASDHSPCPPAMKGRERGDFFAAWGGVASLELGLAAVWTEARTRGFGPEHVARWMCERPAVLAGLAEKGRLEVGADADLMLWDPDEEWVARGAELQHRHPITPHEGRTLRGRVQTTLVRGVIVFDAGARPGRTPRFPGTPRGKALDRASETH
jgi:allantoinase